LNQTEGVLDLSDRDLGIFRWFCEKAVGLGNPLASVGIEDVTPDDGLPPIGGIEFGQSIIALIDRDYLQRSGWRHYAITLTGFETYARAYITDYLDKEEAVKDAVATVDRTDTDDIVATTGETRYLVNHVLRLLQRGREIGAFVSESDKVYVTRVSSAFKQAQGSRTLTPTLSQRERGK